MSNPLSRRRFLASTAATGLALAAGASAAPTTHPSIGWNGADKKQLNLGIIGVGGRGFDHVREIKPIPNANVIALCDVDSTHLPPALQHYPHATTYIDFRDPTAGG